MIKNNPIKCLNKKEICLWFISLIVVIFSNILTKNLDLLTLFAACIGITSLILAAKGNAWAQILMIIFSIFYGIISYRFCYWGEMITYLGMTMPMAIWSTITWIKNPAPSGNEVAIQKLKMRHVISVIISGILITIMFYFILKALNTPNIVLSTISITTSFLAAMLTMLRSSYFPLLYAANDIVLILLWILASFENTAYVPVVVNFVIFFINDIYGFICWKKRENITFN